MVLFPSVLYYPYTGKVHVHLMDLDGPVRVTLHLASSLGVPNITLEEQGSDVLQLNWPHFSNVSHGPVAGLRTSIPYPLPEPGWGNWEETWDPSWMGMREVKGGGTQGMGGGVGPILDGNE